ncbi:HET-domain-containing protein [Apiospora phragmitis]|uniref:HET-domain-containing protein n=1 Tax=Apiospora phragmitis TaxID=2905665 RepID=A0ABR1U989_9PEZI
MDSPSHATDTAATNDLLWEWYKDYSAPNLDRDKKDQDDWSLLIRSVHNDEFDNEIDDSIRSAGSYADVKEGFCATCRHGLAEWPCEPDRYPVGLWQVNTLELAAASRGGCKLCAFFLSQMRDRRYLDTFRSIEVRLGKLNIRGAKSYLLLGGNMNKGHLDQLLLAYPGKQMSDESRFHPYSVPLCTIGVIPHPHTTSIGNIDLFGTLSMWLKRCDESHSQCQYGKALERPRRLVSIGGEAIKVIETELLPVLPRYATLSYCWGRAEFTMLTMETLAAFEKGICLLDLPKTQQDAINIAKRLDIDYIWIDALCIIQRQQDHTDWLCESGRMRSIYGGAYVNIAAYSAINVHQGCFVKPKDYISGLYVPIGGSKRSNSQILFDHAAHWKTCSGTNLSKRAWAFQERLLALRTICFGEYGVAWECRSTFATACMPDGLDAAVGFIYKLVCPEYEEWNWDSLVMNYSGAEMTVSSDYLPALAGVARRHSELMKDQYLASMWRNQLINQLLWHVHNAGERPSWRAPTWSWASVDSRVLPDPFKRGTKSETERAFSTVLDVWTRPSGPDIFGAVSGGELTMLCSALVAGSIHLSSTGTAGTTIAVAGDAKVSMEDSQDPISIHLDCVHYIRDEADAAVYLLPVRDGPSKHVYKTPKDKKFHPYIILGGLVLQRIKASPGRFRRIGSFLSYAEPQTLSYRKELLRVIEKVGASTAASECTRVQPSPEDAEMKYVIVIE